MTVLTQELLKTLLRYEPDTGYFYWLKPLGGPVVSGSPAGYVDAQGYHIIGVRGLYEKAHRLAWLYMTGLWPQPEVDHINRNRADNRWCNLREATNVEGRLNSKTRSKYGRGVYAAKSGRFDARIGFRGKVYHIGVFDTPAEASAAYQKARRKFYADLDDKLLSQGGIVPT